jgi:deoxyribodipyrimidine photo-lyase
MTTPNSILWFRRDLRTADHPAFEHAIRHATHNGGSVLPVFVLDPYLRDRSGPNRLAYLYRTLGALIDGGVPLLVLEGKPEQAIAELASAHTAEVFASEDFAPYGMARDLRVAETLKASGSTIHLVDSNYIVPPGTVLKGDGTAFKVFTPFSKVWLTHASGRLPSPRIKVSAVPWMTPSPIGLGVPNDPPDVAAKLPTAGEVAAWERVRTFVASNMGTYDVSRNLPGPDATSRLSADLKYGVIHPRQLLPLIAERPSNGATIFRTELCWREFYADVMFVRPDTIREPFMASMNAIATDEGIVADQRFEAWCQGRTGFPFIDAGMRQLLAEGWMHNRVRMAVASFFVKDLHLPWQRGAKWFMQHLVDGDVASNQHGWQWTAGTGTDASPYFRVFNPISQGQKFDADGVYIKRWIPELAHLSAKAVHEPWTAGGPAFGADLFSDSTSAATYPATEPAAYPAPIVDHAAERLVALDRYKATRLSVSK